jgi:Tfp pilus assembly protein PilF
MFIDRFVQLLPKNGLKKALGFFNKGDYRKAIREFESYLSKILNDPTCQDHEMVRMYMVEAYIGYSRQLAAEGKPEEAATQLERAIELQPGYADVHCNLGVLYEDLGRKMDSRESFRRALKINPNYFRARVMLAKSYHDAGNTSRAVEELEASFSAAQTFYIEHVKNLIGMINGDEPVEQRQQLFSRLLDERPSSAQVAKQIALEAIQNGDCDFAQAELKKALSLNPNYPDLHNLLGIAYANKGMADDAILEFETALKIHPGYLKARLNIALTLYEKGALEASMQNLKVVLELDPENELAKNLLMELQPVTDER